MYYTNKFTSFIKAISVLCLFLTISANSLTLKKGWNLVSLDIELKNLPTEVYMAWQYKNGIWALNRCTFISTTSNT